MSDKSDKSDRKRITIRKFSQELWLALKKRALEEKRPVYEVLEEAVREYLGRREGHANSSRP